MNKVLSIILGGSLILTSAVGFAAAKTDMTNNWNCTTNASSGSTDAEKAADDQMSKNTGSASSSFAMAVQNCRDCTKITCTTK